MFRKMRRNKQKLTKSECENILKNEPRGVLALLGDYDYTYAIPITHVYLNDKIYFHGAKTGHKHDSIEKHSKISYCVMDKGVLNDDEWSYTFKSVIIFGKIKIIDDTSEKIEILTCLGDKFFPTHQMTIDEINKLHKVTEVFEIEIDYMSGKIVEEN